MGGRAILRVPAGTSTPDGHPKGRAVARSLPGASPFAQIFHFLSHSRLPIDTLPPRATIVFYFTDPWSLLP